MEETWHRTNILVQGWELASIVTPLLKGELVAHILDHLLDPAELVYDEFELPVRRQKFREILLLVCHWCYLLFHSQAAVPWQSVWLIMTLQDQRYTERGICSRLENLPKVASFGVV